MTGSLGIASFLVIVGVYIFRIELVVVGFVNPLVQLSPGNAIGTYNPTTSSFEEFGRYTPTWVEYGIILGFFALFAALITTGYRWLHLRDGAAATRRAMNP
jgi:Ni/Fe-hydrogenase subunit HybB-like protein